MATGAWELAHPEKVKEHRDAFHKRNPEARKTYAKKFRTAEHGIRARRNWYYKKQYGISFDEVEARIKKQNGLCPIGMHPFGPIGNTPDSPCVDHCHQTGKLRSILCRRHNAAIGQFNDSVVELQSAIEYLTNHRG